MRTMPKIVAADTAFPRHYYEQKELASALVRFAEAGKSSFEPELVARLFKSVAVGGRPLALPIEAYADLASLEQRNAVWLEVALQIGETAVRGALEKAELAPEAVNLFVSNTTTGVAAPSLEARLMNQLGFSTRCRRIPLFGLGCAGGAAGIARVSDYLRAYPEHAAVLLCVELCSLTFQRADSSVANVIASGLFGDGAACGVVVGERHPLAARIGPCVVANESVFFPNTERMMGWDVIDSGFRVVLNSGIPELARTAVAESIRTFLRDHGLSTSDVRHWIAHPGGPAVIDALERGLELPRGTLHPSRDGLRRTGNLSSVSVLVLLNEILEGLETPPGAGLLLAMGPGFSAELALLEWNSN